MSEEIQEQQEPELIGPGQMLKQAREKAGLSCADIANKLRLKVSNIEDLEGDVYDEAISMTFTRGYLKNYAKQVQLSEELVLEAFDKLNTKSKEPAKLQSFSRRVARQASDDRLMLVTYLIVFAVIALVVVWWWQQSSTDSAFNLSSFDNDSNQTASAENQSTTNEVQSQVEALPAENIPPVNEEPVAQIMSADSQITVEDVVEEVTGEPVQEPSDNQGQDVTDALPQMESPVEEVETAPAIPQDETPDQTSEALSTESVSDISEQFAEASLEAPVAADLADPVELVFQFSGDCWMNLVDATGEAIAYGVKVSGRVMPVSGVPPFEVTLGAPESVQISYDGEAVDMSRFRAGRTARFSLPLTE